ncbi:type III pantothenate kinase [bacterium]|nr:type III pantothenate kinase [bacterium]MBU1652460.1 type III pantothenate kinase [bacterium]
MSDPSDNRLLLAIDVGNTNIVLGIFQGDELRHHWRLTTGVSRTADEAWIGFTSLCRLAGVDLKQISGAAISSVVPDMTTIFADMVRNNFSIVPYEVSAATTPSLTIKYDIPGHVGADRICNAVAGFEMHGGPLVVVDFGTATTFDIIAENGDYLGGVITPGIELSQKILHQKAARLPQVRLHFPDKIIADSTEKSIQAGLMFGTVEKLEGLCRRIWKELGSTGKVIVTGGLAPVIAQHSKVIDAVEPFLVLRGLRILYERHSP